MDSLDDVAIKKDNPPAPEWVTEGVVVVHGTFGRGIVRDLGLYKRFHTIWVDFEKVGAKALSPKYAMPHMRLAESGTSPDGAASRASRLRWGRRGR